MTVKVYTAFSILLICLLYVARGLIYFSTVIFLDAFLSCEWCTDFTRAKSGGRDWVEGVANFIEFV